jgi:hypothetical protein
MEREIARSDFPFEKPSFNTGDCFALPRKAPLGARNDDVGVPSSRVPAMEREMTPSDLPFRKTKFQYRKLLRPAHKKLAPCAGNDVKHRNFYLTNPVKEFSIFKKSKIQWRL